MAFRYVIEAVMLACYESVLTAAEGEITFYIPVRSIQSLVDLQHSTKRIMQDADVDDQTKRKISNLLHYFDTPSIRHSIQQAMQLPWGESTPIPYFDNVNLVVVHAVQLRKKDKVFSPYETELIRTSLKLGAPLICDQFNFQRRMTKDKLEVEWYDISDFSKLLQSNRAIESEQITNETTENRMI